MIPLIEPGYSYEGRGRSHYAFIYPSSDDTFTGVRMTPEGRAELDDANAADAAQWLKEASAPDMAWTAKPTAPPTWTRGEEGFVYFISDEDGFIKIGRALKPEARLANFQIANRQKLVILATVPGGKAKESEMHRQFAGSRHRGEWFTPSDDLLAFIAAARQQAVSPDNGHSVTPRKTRRAA